jgi:Transcriptional regulator PadR-like family
MRWTRVSPLDFFGIIEEMPKPNYLGEFELLVMLTVIRLGEAAYGVSISREIEQHTGRDVAFGTVYATLERLQKKVLSVRIQVMRRRKEVAEQSDISGSLQRVYGRSGKQSRA